MPFLVKTAPFGEKLTDLSESSNCVLPPANAAKNLASVPNRRIRAPVSGFRATFGSLNPPMAGSGKVDFHLTGCYVYVRSHWLCAAFPDNFVPPIRRLTIAAVVVIGVLSVGPRPVAAQNSARAKASRR